MRFVIGFALVSLGLWACGSNVESDPAGGGDGGASSTHGPASSGATADIVATGVTTTASVGGGSTVASTSSVGGGSAVSSTSSVGGGSAVSSTSSVGGGSAVSSTSSVGGGSSVSSTGVGGGSCVGEMTVVIDNAAPVTFSSICAGERGASETSSADGWRYAGGAFGAPHGIELDACTAPDPGREGLVLRIFDADAGVGTYPQGRATYTDAQGMIWDDTELFSAEITAMDPPGGAIEGKFKVFVSVGADAGHSLAGTFRVCHVNDLLAP